MSDKRKDSGSSAERTGKGSNASPIEPTLEGELRNIVLLLESISRSVKNVEKKLNSKPKGIPGIHGKSE